MTRPDTPPDPIAPVDDGAEPTVPVQRAERLLRTGSLRFDATGWFARDRHAAADEIDHVDSDVVRQRVPRARPVPRT